MDHYQYLLLLAACVVVTLPLELALGVRVWRRPGRLWRALVAPVVLFSAWDVAAIAHRQWSYNSRYVTGWDLPGKLPVEEVAFFAVIPICALLTYETVNRMFGRRASPVTAPPPAPAPLPATAPPPTSGSE